MSHRFSSWKAAGHSLALTLAFPFSAVCEAPLEEGPPWVVAESRKVEISAIDQKIETVVDVLNRQLEMPIWVEDKICDNRVSVLADGVPVEDVLSTIANPNGWLWTKSSDGRYGLMSKEYYERGVFDSKPLPVYDFGDGDLLQEERSARRRKAEAARQPWRMWTASEKREALAIREAYDRLENRGLTNALLMPSPTPTPPLNNSCQP